MPRRIQIRRERGWRKPPTAVVVARPSKWGNPYRTSRQRTKEEAIRLYVEVLFGEHEPWMLFDFTLDDVRNELAGKDLACWCPESEPCHADALLAIANGETHEQEIRRPHRASSD